jgi:hypothetical protein
MPTGPGGLDSNGIWQFGEDDSEALASDLLNLGMGSVSTAITNLEPGAVLQVVSVTKTDTFSASVAGGAFSADVTGLTATITPASSSSTILVRVNVSGAVTNFPILNGQMLRGSTAIGVGATDGIRTPVSGSTGSSATSSLVLSTLSVETMDSPATTDATTYNFQLFNTFSTTETLYVNRTSADSNTTRALRAASTITLMEVAG